jgi:hypothetical protein
MTVTLGLVVLAVAAFAYAAVRFQASQQQPQLAVALGLAFLALAIGLFAGVQPPVPPEPTPEPPPVGTDFGGYRPHLQGWGATTRGGRGGEVRIVGTLDAQQLQAAVAGRPGCADTWETCARVVLFSVSGTWDLSALGQLTVTSPYLTIAGQTAPAGGVTFTGARVLIDTHDVVVQHVRVRKPPVSLNAYSVGDAGDGGDNSHVKNVISDHITVSWATDVNNYLQAGPGSTNIMVVDSLIYEGLWTGALGGIGAGVGGDFTFMGNGVFHHWSRQPIWGSPCRGIVANNVIYNGTTPAPTDSLPAFFGDADGDGSTPSSCQSMVVWNVLIPGPDSGAPTAFLGFSKKPGSISAGSKAFLEGNAGPGGVAPAGDGQWATVCGNYGAAYQNAATCGPTSNMRASAPFPWWDSFKIGTLTTNIRDTVLANAGARPRDRDTADTRVIGQVTAGTGTHYLDWTYIQTHYGGMPVIVSHTVTLPVPANPSAPGSRTLQDGTSNTVLEDWLEAEAQTREAPVSTRRPR